MVLRLLEEIPFPCVAGEGTAGPSFEFFVFLFSIMTAASAAVFSVLREPVSFFQQPFCLQPLALYFLRAAWLELMKSFAMWCQPPVSQVVFVVRSTFFLAMHLLFFCSKGNRLVGCEAITHNYSLIGQRLLCIAQVFLLSLLQHFAQQNQCILL